ncbi:hypothetical protein VTI74DRAFT_261 [Chaetomium olivicolor]
MGLLLRNPSLPSLPSGHTCIPRSESSDPDPDSSDLDSLHAVIFNHRRRPHRSPNHLEQPNLEQCSHPLEARQRKFHRLRQERVRSRLIRPQLVAGLPMAVQTRHVKPRNGGWAAEVAEGCALARSAVSLPGEVSWGYGAGGHGRQSPRSRNCSRSGRRRLPSLERQNAFRDEKTAKRRRCESPEDEMRGCLGPDTGRDLVQMEREDAEVEELYRMGLLYDDEYERGDGFSLEKIIREEPVYSVRVRPARKGRREQNKVTGVSLSVDLVFSVLGEDEAFAGWMASGSPEGGVSAPAVRSRETVHDTQLTVIYELADDHESVVEEEDSLVDLDGWADYSVADEEEGYDGNRTAQALEVVDDDVDSWVLLGHDGS